MKFKRNRKISQYFTYDFLLYILGRFKFVKSVVKFLVLLSNKNKIKYSTETHTDLTIDKSEVMNHIKKDGYFSGVKLKDQTLNKILTLCENSKLVSNRPDKITNKYLTFKNLNEVNIFNKNTLEPICMINPVGENLKKLCDEISFDKNLIDIANSFLGRIKSIKTILTWATVCKTNDEWREKYGQSVTYHFDVYGLHYIYVFFYITDCNINSGAHQIIRGSHIKKKFFKHLVGTAKKTEAQLKNDYNLHDFINIEGPAGQGFIEDTSCFHRALPPKNEPRLALQFRYSISKSS